MTLTFKDYIKEQGITSEGAKKRLQKINRIHGTDYPFSVKAPVPDELLSITTAGTFATAQTKPQKKTVAKPKPTTEGETPTQPQAKPQTNQTENVKPNQTKRAKQFSAYEYRGLLLLLINWLETFVSLRGGWVCYGVMGLVVVFAALAFYWYVILEAQGGAQYGFRRDTSLFICAVLACLFGWLHGQAFYDYSPATYTQNCAFAVILSALGWLSNYFTIPKSVENAETATPTI